MIPGPSAHPGPGPETNAQDRRIPLTFIIPVFNRHEELARALASLGGQDVLPQSVVIVDDGSEPPIEIPAGVRTELNVTIVRHPRNAGAAAARSSGILAAETEWVGFLDSDDALLPNTLGSRWEFLQRDRIGGASAPKRIHGCGWLETSRSGSGNVRIPHASSDPMDFAAGCWFSPGSCIIVSRAQVMAAGLPDPDLRRLEDYDWFLTLALDGFELVVAPVIGAEIERTRIQDPEHVRAAAELIRSKWRLRRPARPLLRRLNAYLDLEIAAANHYARHPGAAALYLMRSLISFPRLRLHLSPGWYKPKTPPAGSKRAFDMVLAAMLLIAVSPLLLVLMLAVKASSRGSSLYRQRRVGWNEQPFTCYKLRTMRADAPSVPTHQAPREMITPLGRWLRKCRLDELPQLWNVLRGDMSLVGPRPCLPEQSELIAHRRRLGVYGLRPGVTGLAQIRRIDMSKPLLCAQTDAEYLHSHSLAGDLRIILATLGL